MYLIRMGGEGGDNIGPHTFDASYTRNYKGPYRFFCKIKVSRL